MNWSDWYTDTMDIYRAAQTQDGSLTRQRREPVARQVPCRIYQPGDRAIAMTPQAAEIRQESRVACALSVDLREGDELILYRGGALGKAGPAIRAFAGDPTAYYEPFGAVSLGLAHQEARLLQQERVK